MKKLIKRLLGAGLMVAVAGALAACEHPEGMNEDFYHSAKETFVEIDDDTLELELPDQDDIANYNAVVAAAMTEKEQRVAELLTIIVTYNPAVTKPDATQKDFQPYVQARMQLAQILEIEDQLQSFKFREEE